MEKIISIFSKDWKNINPDFTPELKKEWEEKGFTYEQTRGWINVGLKPTDADFACWLKHTKGKNTEWMLNHGNIEELSEEYQPKSISTKIREREREREREIWVSIHKDFGKESGWSKNYQQLWEESGLTYQDAEKWVPAGFKPGDFSSYLIVKRWKNHNFTPREAREWINTGAKSDDHGFAAWLRDAKKETPQWITNYREDYQILSERFKKYGLCPECNQPNTGEQWCQSCNEPHLKENFPKWTSNNLQVDQFIQKYQLQATDADKFIEWIPYEQFANIEYLAEGGFGKVYKAKWTAGSISHWDAGNKQWYREKDKHKPYREVVLKNLTNSQNNTEFLDETAKHKDIDDWFNNIVPCYGLSQDPNGSYLMVMQYMPEGNLREYLSNKNRELTLKDKISHLAKIAQGLKDIHAKNLVHRDFHSGNILKGIEKTSCLITDLGLCKPANEASQEDKIFGVMPYVAPEVLRSSPYTQASDIYSFGIVAYEILSGFPPYYNKAHDINLAIEICQGSRPKFQIKIPRLLEDLIKRCWDADPKKRPTANELEKILRKWQEEISKEENTEFTKQLQIAEEHNNNLSDSIKFPKYKKHSGATYHSKLLPTKEITKILQNSQLILRQNNNSEELISKQITAEIDKLEKE
ncbi:MAG: hypothetical protein MRECE_15c027, partial [Mycoplasmataceae bacterium CE_OT135]